jgi:hypothetical protein
MGPRRARDGRPEERAETLPDRGTPSQHPAATGILPTDKIDPGIPDSPAVLLESEQEDRRPPEQPAMKMLTLAPALIVSAGMLTLPAAGQSIAQRVAAIQEKRAERDKAARIAMLQVLLYKELTVDFDQVPARDVFDFLKTALGINMIVRYSDDAVGHGIDPETPITLSAKRLTALELLELVLEQCSGVEECAWQLRKSFLEVGTKARLSVPAAREIRWYPIDELIFEPPNFTDSIPLRLDSEYVWGGAHGGYGWGYSGGFFGNPGHGGSVQLACGSSGTSDEKEQRVQALIDLIVEVIEPEAWARNGGERASIRHRDGALIVNAPAYVHRQIIGSPRVPPPDTGSEQMEKPGDGGREKPTR